MLDHHQLSNQLNCNQTLSPARIDDAVSDGGAVDDAAEDVDEDRLHLVVLTDDAERLLNLKKGLNHVIG